MKKLFQFVKKNLLKILVSFLILFIPLYPKLPSVHINHTWVYIRLEDFFISLTILVFFIQLVRKKVTLYKPFVLSIGAYWFFGFLSLIFSLIFLAPQLANFFPSVAILSYLRRIEYMILFFVAFSTIKTKKDIRDYSIILMIAITGIVLYGLGQRMYLYLWQFFPSFFEKYSFCFPSFQTGNEEFAKGVPLCLPPDARVTSTFGGHYDLAAYLVVVIPILGGILFTTKKRFSRIFIIILGLFSIAILIFTSSRQSFIAYIVGITCTLIFLQRKKFILPVLGVSIIILLLFSKSTADRFLQTIRFTSIVTNSEGQVVGESVSSLPSDLQNKVSKNPIVVGKGPPTQNLPAGTVYSTLPQGPLKATSSAVIQQGISADEARRLKLANGGVEISTVSGSFLVQKAIVYDISLTTRFQAEWPNAWNAFMRNPPFGSGYSTITLASDNDYLRFLGESGFFGLFSFLFIFLLLGIMIRIYSKTPGDNYTNGYVLGLAGGLIGLFVNALLIDVFEASKVAEPLWILIGIGVGSMMLSLKQKVTFGPYLKKVLTSSWFIAFYLLIFVGIVFLPSINNFFVGNDFVWLHSAASSTFSSAKSYFLQANNSFYQPLAKVITFVLYAVFSFQPVGYHLTTIFLHFLVTLGVYLLALQLTSKKLLAFCAALIFIVLPLHSENLYLYSTISILLSTVFLLFGLISYLRARKNDSIIAYIISLLLFILALLSFEFSLVFPLLMIAVDIIVVLLKQKGKTVALYVPVLLISLGYCFLRQQVHAETFSQSISSLGVGFSLLALGICLTIFWILQNKWKQVPEYRALLFCFVVAMTTLVPFFNMGNLFARYSYFASIFLVILFVAALYNIFQSITDKKKISFSLLGICIVLMTIFYMRQMMLQQKIFGHAGEIAKNALTYFRLHVPTVPSQATIVVIHLPDYVNGAPVFPVGFTDGLWFIYRDPSVKVESVATKEEAEQLKQKNKKTTDIFNFDDNYAISKTE